MSEHGNEEPAAPALPARTNVLSQTHARQQAAPTQHATSQQIPAPYQPYTYAQPQYVAQSRVVPYDKTWHWIKIALTVTSIIFCLILLGLSVAASMGPGWDSWNITIYWFGPLAGIAGLWDVAELITLFGCGKRNGAEHRRGIHPGAHVGMDLCIWLTGLMCILLSVMSYFSATDQIRYCQEYLASSDTSSSSYRYYYCDEDEYAIISQGFIIPALRALLAFAALLT